MPLTEVLPFALLALSLVAGPLVLFVAFRALKRRDEAARPAPRHSPRRPPATRPSRPRFPGR